MLLCVNIESGINSEEFWFTLLACKIAKLVVLCEYLSLQSVLCIKSIVYCVMPGYGDINIQEIKLQTCIDWRGTQPGSGEK